MNWMESASILLTTLALFFIYCAYARIGFVGPDGVTSYGVPLVTGLFLFYIAALLMGAANSKWLMEAKNVHR